MCTFLTRIFPDKIFKKHDKYCAKDINIIHLKYCVNVLVIHLVITKLMDNSLNFKNTFF